jgi:hypothetical protein
VTGLSKIEEKQGCDTYIVTKHSRAPFPTKVKYRTSAALDLVQGICAAGQHQF